MEPIFTKVAFLTTFLFLASVSLVYAQNGDPFANLTYPIVELGNCQDRKTCEAYCEQAGNMRVCLDFAEKQGLLAKEDIETGRRMLALGQTAGPGGCRGQKQCETYCDQIAHIKECITFAEKNNLIPAEELQEAKKVIEAIDRGLTPPSCKGKKECDVFCSKPENMEGCIKFAIEAGIMPPEEAQDAQKMLAAIQKGVKPPACAGKQECDIYCQTAEHMQECMEFGIAAGFMPPEEMENAKKTLEALKKGIRPPNCQGKDECDAYCQTQEHMQECMEFGIAAGFMPQEEIENAKKTLEALKKGIRPPNCQGKEECDAYCQTPEHMVECMEFSIAAGFMPAEQLENAKKMLEAFKQGVKPLNCKGEEECNVYCQMPEHMAECMEFGLATGSIPPEQIEDTKKTLEAIKKGIMPPNCRGEEECNVYCQQPEHRIECINFAEATGNMTSEEAERARSEGGEVTGPMEGPGGCKTPEECQTFCQQPENVAQCQQFMTVPSMPMIQPGPQTQGIVPQQGVPPQEGMPPQEGSGSMGLPSPAPPPDSTMIVPPSPEQIQQMQQQMMQQQMQEQMQGQVPPQGEITPPAPGPEPAPPPQSFLQRAERLFGNLLLILLK